MIDWFFGSGNVASGGGMFFGGGSTKSGEYINQNTALNYSAVFCATRIISETASMLPLFLYEETEDGGRKRAKDHRWYGAVKNSPNNEMGSMAFREGRTKHQVNWGNGFAEIANDGSPALYPIHPARVRGDRLTRDERRIDRGDTLRAGQMVYRVRGDDGTESTLTAAEMLHVPGVLSDDGVWGMGVIDQARESIGFGVATEKHGAEFFGNHASPAVVVTTPGLADSGKRAEARAEWKQLYKEPGNPAFLPPGSEVKVLGLSNEASQFLETRQHNITEIARWYRIPPHMLADLMRSTNNNIEHQGIEFVIYSLMPWLRRWEEQLNLKLLSRSERNGFYFEHQINGLLRGDIKSRYEAYRQALANGFMTINEVRKLENLNPIGPAGDASFIQLNMTTVERAMEGPPEKLASVSNEQASAMFDSWTRSAMEQMGSDGKDAVRRLECLEKQLARLEAPASKPSVSVLRPAIVDALSRMYAKEVNEARRSAKKADFPSRSAEFYGKHQATVADSLLYVESMAKSVGATIDAAVIAREQCAASQAELTRLYDTATPEQFDQAISSWPTQRAEAVADAILQGAE